MDVPPITTNTIDDVKIKDFELKKNTFSVWVENYINNLYQNGTGYPDNENQFCDPVSQKIDELVGDDRKITNEIKDLTFIFGEKIVNFSNNIIFDKDYDKVKIKNFYSNLYNNFFNRSPTIFENLNIDFLQKIVLASKINETQELSRFVDISGELSYDLSFCSVERIEKLTKEIGLLNGSEKISALKQLSSTAMTAYGNGSWAYSAFKGIINLMKEMRDNEQNPLISFISDFELRKIQTFSNNLDNFEQVDSIEEYKEEYLYEDIKTTHINISKESDEFFRKNSIIPELSRVYFSKVSKDYGSIISADSLIPIALVKQNENNFKVEDVDRDFSFEEIKRLNKFQIEIDKNNKDDQFWADIMSFIIYIKDKNIDNLDISEIIDKDRLSILDEKFIELNNLTEKIQKNQVEIQIKIEKENFSKTKEAFNFVDLNFNNIFVGMLESLGQEWLDYKKDNYDEGLFEVFSQISGDYGKIKNSPNINKTQLGLIRDISAKQLNIKQFHSNNWESMDQKIKKLNTPLYYEYDKEIINIVAIVKNINIEKLSSLVKEIIERNKVDTKPLPIKNYDGFTKDKEFNPLGSDDFSHLIKIFHTPEIRQYINNRLNIKIEDLMLIEQIHFLKFLSTSDKNTFSKIEKVLSNKDKQNNINFLKSFISMSGSEEMGNKILTFGEKLPDEVAQKIFAKYGEIINTFDNCEEEIKKIFGDKDVPIRVLTSVKETLLKRGAKMLSDLGDKVLDSKFELNENEILKELDEIREETIILGESYVGLYKEGIRVPIEEVTTIKETPTEKLTEEQKKELVKIYEKGRPKVTYDKKGHLEFLKKEFEDELNDKDISITEICFKNETIVIALVDRKEKDSLYIGGLTFVEDVKNAVVAEATMSHVLEKFKDKNIRALVDSRNPILRMYMNRFGFKITKKLDSEEEIKNNGGEIYYEIERPKEYVLEERQEFKNVA